MQEGGLFSVNKEVDSSSGDESMVKVPDISLPKGGGAIRGIGEKFAANPDTGTGSMSVPIATSPGRSGFGPQLSLSYDSGAGNGPFGLGWHLSLPAITRKTDKGLPRYWDTEESDDFILSGAEDLVPVLVKNDQGDWIKENVDPRKVDNRTYDIQHYRPRIEGLFGRIERWTNQTQPADTFWRSISKDNITTWYGKTDDSRIADPKDPNRIFSWLICESYDDKGNAMIYEYAAEDSANVDISKANEQNRTKQSRSAARYLKRIKYGNKISRLIQPDLSKQEWLFEVVFDYEEGHYTLQTPDAEERQFVQVDMADQFHSDASRKWQVREDPFSSYRSGFEVRSYRLCHRVLMFHHFEDELGVKDYLVRSTEFSYKHSPIASFISSATQSGYKHQNNNIYLKKSLPPVDFQYSEATIQQKLQEIDAESLENLPQGLDGAQYQWADLDGEGPGGILAEQGGAWFYKRNLSPLPIEGEQGRAKQSVRFEPAESISPLPSFSSLANGEHQLMDLAGDGQVDVVTFEGTTPGFFERSAEGSWQPHKSFKSLPNINWKDPNLKFVDLTGDGHADIFVTEDQAFSWYASLAEEGFGLAEKTQQLLDEENGPRLVFADGTQSIYLSDMSGDGLTDLVRIRNGEVCYWPNLGYCRFGAKVTMDNAPWFDSPDQFNQQHIRLADIDGSGVVDILYLKHDGIHIYLNQSGNHWANATVLELLPAIDNYTNVMVADLMGNGTACLVWSSPLSASATLPMFYVDLMGGQKPHLLIKSNNNLGAETHVYYAPSTKFYLEDKHNGKPWITKIPFPVQVVERVETIDWISQSRFSSHYAYHNGYFDGVEREFRGFGMVEQWDTEEYTAIEGNDEFLDYANIDKASHIPPMHTKTWFHTGAYLGGAEISLLFAKDYYGAPVPDDPEYDQKFTTFVNEQLLPDTILEPGLPVEEAREACRSLKGAMLRQEVYADDGTDKAQHPYSVTEQNFTIRQLQSRAGNRHAVFFTHAREAISYNFERNPHDPRISHALTLEVDHFGNILKSAAIGYGRALTASETMFQAEDQEKQKLNHIICTENTFTNPIIEKDDVYRTPLPVATCTYELRKHEQDISGNDQFNRYRLEDMLAYLIQAGDGQHDIAYEDLQFAGAKQAAANNVEEANYYFRRLIEQVRTLYRADDLSALLPLGEKGDLALPGESYKLAFTPGLLDQCYQRPKADRPTEKLLPDNLSEILVVDDLGLAITGQGGYVELDGDGHWWIPSGRVFFSPDQTDTPQAELESARQCFFMPRRYRDPFGHSATVDLDYCLLMRETSDALGNTVRADNDFRVLQPKQMTDSNGNRTQVALDALGLVVASAVMGKEGETDPESIGDTLEDPTTRMEYELFAWRDHGQPNFVHTFAREQHGAANPRWQESYLYSDGFGRELQSKVQAEPGVAHIREAQAADKPYTPGVLVRDTNNDLAKEYIDSRWVGTGRTVYNNKGKPVKQYEPFFSSTSLYESETELVETGVTPTLFYDPVGRVVATLHPNHTYQKVLFNPWYQETWDVNDTLREEVSFNPADDPDVGHYFSRLPEKDYLPTWYALRMEQAIAEKQWPDETARKTEQSAAAKALAHAATPATAHLDSLGRSFLTLAHNRFQRNGVITDQQYATRVELDIEGNQRAVIDAKDCIVMRYDYDMLGNVIHQTSMEAGARWILNDVAGQPLHAWDDRSHHFWSEYDALHRPVHQYVRGHDGEHSDPRTMTSDILVQKIEYGEGQANAIALNLRTRVYKSYDNAGVVTSKAYDFKGNLLNGHRQLTVDYKNLPDWAQAVPLDTDIAGQPQRYTTSIRYDALNRPVEAISPDQSISRPAYNEANLLERLEVNLRGAATATPFVTNIDYDAKGQRDRIDYGNGVTTRYDYDSLTFRLMRLHTTRPAGGNGLTADIYSDSNILQDLRYTYDPAGNITRIADEALQISHYGNQKVEPVAHYTYDALYRLIEAEGREHIGQTALQLATVGNYRDHQYTGFGSQPNDPKALRNYIEQYEYDALGSFAQFKHQANGGSWQRNYFYEALSLLAQPGEGVFSNRLSHTILHPNSNNPIVEPYTYDPHGNMTKMPHLPRMEWDYRDQLISSSRQVVNNGGVPETTWYVYDATGQRVRKITELANGHRKNQRIYLGGFEIYHEYNGDDTTTILERETLHIMDDKQRITLVETKTLDVENTAELNIPLIRYQLGNHLGSASLELDRDGAVISYEEYHPYGTTAFQAYRSQAETNLKRYRYTGMERDEETGLNYHGARYYAGWLGRWCSCDPTGLRGGMNLYEFSVSNPITFKDPLGTEPIKSSQENRNKMIDFLISQTYSRSEFDHLMTLDEGEQVRNILGRSTFTYEGFLELARERTNERIAIDLKVQESKNNNQTEQTYLAQGSESDMENEFRPVAASPTVAETLDFLTGDSIGGATYGAARTTGASHDTAMKAGQVASASVGIFAAAAGVKTKARQRSSNTTSGSNPPPSGSQPSASTAPKSSQKRASIATVNTGKGNARDNNCVDCAIVTLEGQGRKSTSVSERLGHKEGTIQGTRDTDKMRVDQLLSTGPTNSASSILDLYMQLSSLPAGTNVYVAYTNPGGKDGSHAIIGLVPKNGKVIFVDPQGSSSFYSITKIAGPSIGSSQIEWFTVTPARR